MYSWTRSNTLSVVGGPIRLSCWPRCIWPVTCARLRQRTLIFMTPIAVICVVVAALCIGYHFGRRAGSRPSTWKKRTSRAALGRVAAGLIVSMIARRVQRNFLAKGAWAVKFTEPLQLLRSGLWLQRFR
jgi:CDP-diglyceride synthetase